MKASAIAHSAALVRSAMAHLRTPLYFNAYALMASNLITAGLGLVFWSLAARLFEVEVLGISSAVISTMLFLTGVSQLNLRIALLRLVPEAGLATRRLVLAAFGLSLLVSAGSALLVFGAMVATGGKTLAIDGLASAWGVVVLAIGTMTWSIFNLQDGVLAGLRRTVWVPVENGLYSLGKVIVLVFMAGSMPVLGILISWIVPMIVAVVVVSAVILRRWVPAHMARSSGRSFAMGRNQLFRFVAADYVGSLFSLALTGLLPVVIVAIAGPRAGAYFYIVWTISTSLNLLPVNLCASMTVETIHAEADLALAARTSAIHMARVLVPAVVGVVLLADWILRIFGSDYVESGTVALRVLALGVLPLAVNTLFMAASRIRGRGRDILVMQAVLFVLTVTGSTLLLGSLGITGVALSWAAAQTLVAAVVGTRFVWPLIRGAAAGAPAPKPSVAG